MNINIWEQCEGKKYITHLQETSWRLVETQEVTATRKLVDSLEEQEILEDLIENNKPALPKNYLDYHPLLYTPFRYPPLKYGSRFGTKSEAALWYGSLQLSTAMAEKAFYKFNFLRASETHFENVEERLTAFSIEIKTNAGIKLTAPPFDQYINLISSPISYQISQRLGNAMRNENIQAFVFQSARTVNPELNIGLFSPHAFLYKNPIETSFQSWTCIANKGLIEFVQLSSLYRKTVQFSIKNYLIENQLPFPAN